MCYQVCCRSADWGWLCERNVDEVFCNIKTQCLTCLKVSNEPLNRQPPVTIFNHYPNRAMRVKTQHILCLLFPSQFLIWFYNHVLVGMRALFDKREWSHQCDKTLIIKDIIKVIQNTDSKSRLTYRQLNIFVVQQVLSNNLKQTCSGLWLSSSIISCPVSLCICPLPIECSTSL